MTSTQAKGTLPLLCALVIALSLLSPTASSAESTAAGSLMVWGSDGDNHPAYVPSSALDGVTLIRAYDKVTAVLKEDGHVTAWGARYRDMSSAFAGLDAIATFELGGEILVLSQGGHLMQRSYEGVETRLPFDPEGFTAIAAGDRHFLALKNSGKVVGWGANEYGAATPPPDLDGVIAVAAGYDHSIALRGDGTVVAWGSNREGQSLVPSDLGPVSAVAAGPYISMVLRMDGTVAAWGHNFFGLREVPPGLRDVVAIDIGTSHAIAVRKDGTVVAWGDRSRGRVDVPVGLTGVTAIAAGNEHSVALGIPVVPEIQKPPIDQSVSPWQTATLTVQAAGFDLRYQWSRNGQPVPNATNSTLSYPGTIVCNAAGEYSVEVRNRAGSVASDPVNLSLEAGLPPRTIVTWGESNEQGFGAVLSEKDIDIVAISTGGYYGEWFSVVLLADGTVRAWGDNGRGQTNVPPGLGNIRTISAGAHHTAALDASGRVTVWGQNDRSLQPPKSLAHVTSIAAGHGFTLALKNDGTVVEWGYNTGLAAACFGKRIRTIAAGGGFAIAIADDDSTIIRSIFIDGLEPYYATRAPSRLSNVVQVAIGGSAGGAVHGDGTLTVWGDPRLVDPIIKANLQQVAQIATSSGGISVIKRDGSLFFYTGEFDEPRFAPPRGLSNVLAVSAAYLNCAAIGKASLPLTHSTPSSRSMTSWVTDSLEVDALGFGLNYLWYHGDRALLGETNATLHLPSVRETASGDYSVVVSNAAGAVTNRVAWIEVVPEARPGTVVSWGYQRDDTGSWSGGIATVPNQLTEVVQISAGGDHDLAVRSDGTTVSWGRYAAPYGGQYRKPPLVPPTGSSFIQSVAAGPSHALALRHDGTVLGWGGGDGNAANVPEGLSNIVSIAAGPGSSWAIRGDGSLVSWGDHGFQSASFPENLGLIQAVAPPAFLRKDGTVAIALFAGPLIDSGISNAVAISAGNHHVLALTQDGLVKVWDRRKVGSDSYFLNWGQSDVPPDLKDVVAIAAGSWFSMALKKDGTVTTWGAFAVEGMVDTESPQPPAGLRGVTAIAAGELHALALVGPVAPPPIRIVSDSSGVVIFWPVTASGFRPEVSEDLDPPNWQPLSSPPTISDGWNHIPLSFSASAHFFRLSQTIE